MKLIIKEHGDSSVGIPERYYEVECPFERDEVDETDLISFKTEILHSYRQFAEMKTEAFYEDEPTWDLPPELEEIL